MYVYIYIYIYIYNVHEKGETNPPSDKMNERYGRDPDPDTISFRIIKQHILNTLSPVTSFF